MASRPRLTRAFVAAHVGRADRKVALPPGSQLQLPERAVQFGTGALLRGFVEYFIDEANRAGKFNGSIVAVSSTGSGRDEALNAQDGLYTLVVRGFGEGMQCDEHRVISSLSRAISATDDWNAVLAVARDPNIELVFSNTTEVGIALDESDVPDRPRSFPGKLTRFLYERATAFDFDPARGVVVVPCELIDDNGARLREIVSALAARWGLGPRFDGWLDSAVPFCNTLVDRIVTGTPGAAELEQLGEEHGFDDAMVTVCEPYRLFAIEADDAVRARLGFAGADPGITVAPDIAPFRERKVRVLNGVHTITAPVAILAGLDTVRAALANERVGRFMRRAAFDEIVPSLSAPHGERFAGEVFERFANPFLEHALIDITLQGTMKMRTRIVPSIVEYHRRTGRIPAALTFGFTVFLLFMRGETRADRRARGLKILDDAHADALARHWHNVDIGTPESLRAFVNKVCADRALWGDGLAAVPGFLDAVNGHLTRAARHGVRAALDTLLAAVPVMS